MKQVAEPAVGSNGEPLKKKRIKPRMTREALARKKVKALADYKRGDPLWEIAIRYDTSTTAVSLWAKQAKLPRRDQGCRRKDWPEEEDIDIVNAVKAVKEGKPTLEEIGQMFGGKSKANIHRIYTKWKNWKPTIPYKKGDRLRFGTKDVIVIKPDVFHGEVQDTKTGERTTICWKQKVNREKVIQAVKI